MKTICGNCGNDIDQQLFCSVCNATPETIKCVSDAVKHEHYTMDNDHSLMIKHDELGMLTSLNLIEYFGSGKGKVTNINLKELINFVKNKPEEKAGFTNGFKTVWEGSAGDGVVVVPSENITGKKFTIDRHRLDEDESVKFWKIDRITEESDNILLFQFRKVEEQKLYNIVVQPVVDSFNGIGFLVVHSDFGDIQKIEIVE